MLEAEVVTLGQRALALELVASRSGAQGLQGDVGIRRAVLLLLLLVEGVVRRGRGVHRLREVLIALRARRLRYVGQEVVRLVVGLGA